MMMEKEKLYPSKHYLKHFTLLNTWTNLFNLKWNNFNTFVFKDLGLKN